jgi:hypothetical protein
VSGGLAWLVGLILAFTLAAGAPDVHDLLLGAGLFGLVLLSVGVIFRWSTCIVWATGLLGLEYVIGLLDSHAGIDGRAALVGVALYLMSELAHWSIELRSPIQDDLVVYRWRATAVAGVAAGGAILSSVPLLAAELSLPASPLLTLIGTAAAVSVLAVLVATVWRTASGDAAAAHHQHGSSVTNRPSSEDRG